MNSHIQVINQEPLKGANSFTPTRLLVWIGVQQSLLLFYPNLNQVLQSAGDHLREDVCVEVVERVTVGKKSGQVDGGCWEIIDSDRYLAIYSRLSHITV